MYVNPNYRTKKALKEAIAQGATVEVYQPNNVFNVQVPANGSVYLEGPHYPEPHRWYAKGVMKDGKLIAIK
jgi:hypothetical protein